MKGPLCRDRYNLTRTMLGKNTGSFLSLEDLPFELDHQYGRLQLQEMAEGIASEKLECSKKVSGVDRRDPTK